MLKSSLVVSVVLSVMTLTGCSQSTISSQNTGKLPITVSITPQKYFVERIGGDQVKVNVMVQPGTDPHTYEPKPEQLIDLSQTKAYFTIGVSLEQAWMDRLKAANGKMLVIDTSQGVDKIPIEAHAHDHKPDENAQHSHEQETLDPHIWLSPKRVKIQAKTIYETLVKLDPTNQAKYQENFAKFIKDLDALDAEIRQNLAGVKGKKFLVFHPEWGYFAEDYGLEMIPIEVEGTEPSAAELSALITQAKAENIKLIIAQPELSAKSAEIIAKEIGGKVIFLSAFSADWLENMRLSSQQFAQWLVSVVEPLLSQLFNINRIYYG